MAHRRHAGGHRRGSPTSTPAPPGRIRTPSSFRTARSSTSTPTTARPAWSSGPSTRAAPGTDVVEGRRGPAEQSTESRPALRLSSTRGGPGALRVLPERGGTFAPCAGLDGSRAAQPARRRTSTRSPSGRSTSARTPIRTPGGAPVHGRHEGAPSRRQGQAGELNERGTSSSRSRASAPSERARAAARLVLKTTKGKAKVGEEEVQAEAGQGEAPEAEGEAEQARARSRGPAPSGPRARPATGSATSASSAARSCASASPERRRARDRSRALRFQPCGGKSAQGAAYIMPPMPPMSGMPPPAAPSFSGGSATMHSVVRMFLAIEAAFCSAERVTMVGSMTPSLIRSP